jgi:transposase
VTIRVNLFLLSIAIFIYFYQKKVEKISVKQEKNLKNNEKENRTATEIGV